MMGGLNLSAWALRHRSLVIYCMIAVTIAGLNAYLSLGRDEDPNFTFRTMVVQAVWQLAPVYPEWQAQVPSLVHLTPNAPQAWPPATWQSGSSQSVLPSQSSSLPSSQLVSEVRPLGHEQSRVVPSQVRPAAAHTSSVQSVSSQSTWPSQSLSEWSPQEVSLACWPGQYVQLALPLASGAEQVSERTASQTLPSAPPRA